MATSQKQSLVILRRKELEARTGLSRSTIYAKLSNASSTYDPTFPKQVRLGASSVGWLESEVDAWIEARAESRGAMQ